MLIDGIARVAHESLRAYRNALGEPSAPNWDGATLAQRERMLETVKHVLTHPDCDLHAVCAGLAVQDFRKARLVRAVILSLMGAQ